MKANDSTENFIDFMIFIIVIVLINAVPSKAKSSEYANILHVDTNRMSNNIIERSHLNMDYIYNYSKIYDIEPWIILGIIINESNSSNIVSKDGYDYGLGQIRCFDKKVSPEKRGFSWLNFLKNKSVINKCSDLLNPDTNIKSMAVILNYIKKSYKKKHDRHLLTYYHKGVKWKNYDVGYYSRVYYYGKYSLSQYPNKRIKLCI